jgi:FKBP12-rapamycin complex-associated protein
MSVLREHKESILAVLEAFVYDPLINWKMGNKPMRNTQHSGVVGVESSTNANEEGLAHSVEGGSGGQNMKALTVLDRVSAKLAGSMSLF